MNRLNSFYDTGELENNQDGHFLDTILYESDIFFCLDKNLNREDIEFMLQDLIHVPLIRKLPARFTGESIVKGELSKYVSFDDLSNVKAFIDSSRNAFEVHLNWISCMLPKDCRGSLLTSKFNLPGNSTSKMVAQHIYPQIPSASSSPDRCADQTSQFANEPKENMEDTIPGPSVKVEKRNNAEGMNKQFN
jgi:hypothetical protein